MIIQPAATYTLTLEKALTDSFVLALQQEMRNALVVTASENFNQISLPACFVKCTRNQESIVNSAIFQFSVDIILLAQADDTDAQAVENLWSNILCISHDVFGLTDKLNAIRPQFAFVYGILRDGPVSFATNERHFERSVRITVHASLIANP
jgi:hypothetical protein